jgi:DNA-binding response OmpR family regulator
MPRILVIDDDSQVCEMVADCFRHTLDADVYCALTGTDGARLLMGYEFDLAVIDVILPGVSGLALAELAANENTPVLLTSGHPVFYQELVRFNFPHLKKPFDFDVLAEKASSIIRDTRENVSRVRTSATEMRRHLDALEAALEQSFRLVTEAKARTPRKRQTGICPWG